MSLWGSFTSYFIPRARSPQLRSRFEGDPERARKERPLPTYTNTRWYQADVENAIHAADAGDIQQAARLARSCRRDGTIGGLLSTRTGGLMRLPKRFRGTPNVVAALENHEEIGVGIFEQAFSPKELSLFLGDGILLGVAVGEMLWLPGRELPVFVRLDPEFLRYRWSEDRWYYMSEAGPLPITPGDGRWLLHTPGGYQQPWANGSWANLGRSYIAKDHAFHYRENYSGKLANPARVAVAPQGATEAQKQSWFQKVMAWGVNTVFGMAPGYDVKLLESNGRGYEIFQQTIETADREFMISIAGQIVTVTGGAGFANADIHATIRSDIVQDDADGLAYTINSQGLACIVNRRYGGDASGSVQWDTRPPADLKAEAEAMTACATAVEQTNRVFAPYGMKVDAREMATRFKVPVIALAPAAEAVTPTAQGERPMLSLVPDQPEEDGVVTEDASAALAAKMTEHSVPRCEHGKSSRCWLCGIERVRDFEVGKNGQPEWAIAWRPIAPVAA